MRVIECARCRCELAVCSEYELYTGNMDYGEPNWGEDYGGEFDGNYYCTSCYEDVIADAEAETEEDAA